MIFRNRNIINTYAQCTPLTLYGIIFKFMEAFMLQIFIIFIFSLIGIFISNILPFPIPGSIIGMLLLFGALEIKLIKLEAVENGANTLMQYLSLFFVPLTVGVLDYLNILSTHAISLIIVTLFTTIITYVITAKIMDGRV